jgi:hypothetical protein
MHKKIPVADIEIDSVTGVITKIEKVHNIKHTPVGIEVKNGVISRNSLHEWWIGRSIPASRSGIREALEILEIASTRDLLDKCFGLSLSDQYWINSHENPLDWDKINFFENDFSEDVGNVLFGKAPEGKIDLVSPDNTSDGWLKKKWIIANGKRFLLKGGSPPAYQEPLNEALASAIMRRLNISHIDYTLTSIDGYPMSLCEDFVTVDTELVPAWHILKAGEKRQNHISVYQHFLDTCEELGIPNMKDSIDKMLVVDFLIANADRHFNNFGAIRNANTLEWTCASPIFDCGTSMWYHEFTHNIRPKSDAESKPFKTNHSEQIKLVSSFDWINFNALEGIDEEFHSIYKPSNYMDKARIEMLLSVIKKRIQILKSS